MCLISPSFQGVITQVNHAIGAEGVVSIECKQVISDYGEQIWDLLVAGVCSLCNLFTIFIHRLVVSTVSRSQHISIVICRYNLTKFVYRLVYVLPRGIGLPGKEVCFFLTKNAFFGSKCFRLSFLFFHFPVACFLAKRLCWEI